MKTAIVTGASAGLGREFVLALGKYFPDIESYWLIARREDRMRELIDMLPGKDIKILSLDLLKHESFDKLGDMLASEQPDVRLLINTAGCGYLNNVGDGALDEQLEMCDLNMRAVTAVTHLTIPYISDGGRIINISSISSFVPNSRLTVYSATKSYITAFSRGIGDELRHRHVKVTVAFPGPMDTEFIYKGRIMGKSKPYDILPFCNPRVIANGALRTAKAGRRTYVHGIFYNYYNFAGKFFPHKYLVPLARA